VPKTQTGFDGGSKIIEISIRFFIENSCKVEGNITSVTTGHATKFAQGDPSSADVIKISADSI
jgi:hypothetical protein